MKTIGRIPKLFSAVCLAALLSGCAEDVSDENAASFQQEAAVVEPQSDLTGEQLFIACQSCHSIEQGAAHKVGPNLYGLLGQPAASREGYNYSKALKESGIVWNKGLLLGWVLSAETMVPATWMVYHNHLSVEESEKLVDYLIAKIDS